MGLVPIRALSPFDNFPLIMEFPFDPFSPGVYPHHAVASYLALIAVIFAGVRICHSVGTARNLDRAEYHPCLLHLAHDGGQHFLKRIAMPLPYQALANRLGVE